MVTILLIVDLALGPTLTLIIASPRKPRRELARDIGVIVTVQLAALIYGAATLWLGRPLYYTFSADRLEIVQATDLDAAELALARRNNPALAPHWYSRPRWVWAPLPEDPHEAAKIVNSTIFGGGEDVIDMPRYFKPWAAGLTQLRGQLAVVADMKQLHEERAAACGGAHARRSACLPSSATRCSCGASTPHAWSRCSIPTHSPSGPFSGRNCGYGAGAAAGALISSHRARNASWSAKSSICIHTGLPAPCPARVSTRIRMGLEQICAACSAAANL